jgi:hypothetical protein
MFRSNYEGPTCDIFEKAIITYRFDDAPHLASTWLKICQRPRTDHRLHPFNAFWLALPIRPVAEIAGNGVKNVIATTPIS